MKEAQVEEFNTLLSFLDSDRAKAAERYESIRSRLIRFFEARGTMVSEDLADQTIDRVSRRLQDGLRPVEFSQYFLAVANVIYKEHLRREMQRHSVVSGIASSLARPQMPEAEEDRRLEALRAALSELPPEQRHFLLTYYRKENTIRNRKELADSLGIPLNALRIRAHRLRGKLEQQISEKLQAETLDFTDLKEEDLNQVQTLEVNGDTPTGDPDILVIWDPDILGPEEYSELIGALGDLVRTSGGLGVTRAQPESYSVPSSVAVPV